MSSPQAEAILERIRSEIQRYGQCIVGCDQLLVLVSNTDPIGIQFGHIFATALRQKWSLEFRNDGAVRFASLDCESPTTTLQTDWDSSSPRHSATG